MSPPPSPSRAGPDRPPVTAALRPDPGAPDDPRAWAGRADVVAYRYAPLWWHRQGRLQTATGYGSRLTSPRIAVLPGGHSRRVYVTLWSNVGTAWIVVNGRRWIVSDAPWEGGSRD